VYVVQADSWYISRCSEEAGSEQRRSCVAICDGQNFLGAFSQSQKALVTFVMSVVPSVRMFHRGQLFGLP
jgi:hypothetical protein